MILYGLLFFIPKPVLFNYAGDTCVDKLTTLPDLHRTTDENYEVSHSGVWKIGKIAVASTKTCFERKTAPRKGTVVVGEAPFGGVIARTMYRVEVPEPPRVDVASIRQEIAVSKPLSIAISQEDAVHSYRLAVGDKEVPCVPEEKKINCDLPALDLAQGVSFDYSVHRYFQYTGKKVVGSGAFQTLRAVAITSSTVAPDQILYSRLNVLSFTTDKPIAKAAAKLLLDGKPVEHSQQVDGSTVHLRLSKELPREQTYELTIASIEARDGSTLVEPYTFSFKTSGGPKVSGVSVRSTGVSQAAAIIVTFDQPLSKSKDITSLMSLSGGRATIQKRSDTQVVVQLQGLPLCQPFTITLKPGAVSAHDIPSTQAWNFNGRTICYQASNYGTSLKGRPLTAYLFGNTGPTTMYVGGIHGNEPSSTSLMRAWISQLEANPARYANKRILVVPAINPDGLASGTRTNSRGVNLNRNFPTDNWVKSIKDTDGNHPTGGGASPLSEPEAAALARLTTSYRPRLLLSFHAVGSLAIGDPGGYSARYAARYASMVGYRDGTNSGNSNFDYNISGAYEDWTYRNAGVPSIVVELSSYSSVNSSGHYKALWAMLD